jgi:ParB family chromosome partitioning protein
MKETIESVKKYGVLTPAIVRQKDDGCFEMISGHRRKEASKRVNIQKLPCIIKKLTDDEATILMVDSNIQREKILPSEKAFAYKMKLEALKHQGKRNDLTLSQIATKLPKDTATLIGEYFGESRDKVYRTIRLTYLIKEILNMVDENKVAFSPAVEISYLTPNEQYILVDCMREFDATPSQAQAIHLKKLSQESHLNADKIEQIMSEEKANQIPKYNISYTRFEKYFPRNIVTPKEVEDFLFICVEEHYKRERKKERER